MAENGPVVTAPHGLAGARDKASNVESDAAASKSASRCPSCGQHFTSDARFCPFDGDALVGAPGYRADADPLIGTVIGGRYEVKRVLGEGGMGTVYGVRHRSLDKAFALKVMRADMARQSELAERFIQEARAAAAIGHPNIVQITDFGEQPNRAPYFVMELLDGVSLSKLLRSGGPPPFARALRLLKQVAAALGAAHAAGVVHRDLKPDNIHVTANDVIKVLDFGVAKMAGAGRLTRTGMVFGTPHYMSPEQASGGAVDHRTDIYALGIIMYEMFAGRVPFEADSYMGVLTKHMFMVPEPPSRVNAAVRELGALEDVTLRCLEKKPEARYASMDALIAEIESIARVGADDRLEILRPRSEAAARPAFALADELEPPAREELSGVLRAAGVPADAPRALVWGGLAIAVLCAGIGFAWLRSSGATAEEHARPAPASPGAVRPAPAAVAPTAIAPAQAARAAQSESSVARADDGASVPPPTTPAPSAKAQEEANGRARSDRPTSAKPGPNRSEPKGRATPAAARPTYGAGDIVNPWAK
jgi:serine/threonine-protein kinase